jgi:F-type H+-transporting ATPase subunit epsilon
MSEILLELVTPEGTLVSESIQELTAVTESGEIGVLKNHAELKSKMVSAPLRYKLLDNSVDVVAVLGGVIEVGHNKITVLTDFAQKADDIDEVEAEQEAKRAEAEIQTLSAEAKESNPKLMLAEVQLQKELIKLKASRLKKQF